MSLHNDLIGGHPTHPGWFEQWFDCEDIEPTDERCHRALTSKLAADDEELIKWLADRIIHHHYDQSRIDRLKQKYAEIGYPEYAEQFRAIPRADKTKKGNATEIFLIDYIESCQGKALVKAFKLRYNPNVDQAIKGDDTLLVDVITDAHGDPDLKVYMGEAKFRKVPSKTVVDAISKSLGKDKLPLSYSYLVNELNRDAATVMLSKLLDQFIIKDIKTKGNLVYTGLLLSNERTQEIVDTHLTTNNPDLIFISAGIENPETLINEAFLKAEQLIANPLGI